MKLFTIGFTKKTARDFFELLQKSGVERIIDVRLNNVSQLASFAKKNDLAYFLEKICNVEYVHTPELAPTKEILEDYKKRGGDWSVYEEKFLSLMKERKVENTLSKQIISEGCLLCSEHKPHHCHRRLVAEYLKRYWGDIDVIHLE